MKLIFVLGCILIASVCSAQVKDSLASTDSSSPILFSKNNYNQLFDKHFDFRLIHPETPNSLLTPQPITLGNPFMSGMFCKIEYNIESLSKVTPRFRLGSLNYTEWMEGKQEIYMRYRN
jgi:hypothetical protein